ncbi:transcriptional regulator, LysR family [Stigmatella aurantiaca]|uniref:Transcriptional regulator, LysR family n=1 Tax=Stigmatella aurantiaca TaxID=41 RepID=A0A1H7JCZ7_STIAU|nr:LysR substrate-binding domain-containing protein [Stigmatella aurantiaca]SEK72483.1 transcriptional regulator, LysR family [Stigmatella aurantiaca]
MELRHLRYFAVLAEELHFARAAKRLRIGQPALSMQLKALEEELETRLLERTRRHVALTEAGRLFLEQARQLLEHAERAAQIAKRAGRGELGRIGIGYSVNAAYSGILAKTLKAFRQRAPDVELLLHELHPHDQIEALLEGRIQAGFITAPSQRLPPELTAVRVGAWPLRVAVPSGHPLAQRDRVSPSTLREESFIDYAGSKDEQGLPALQRIMGFAPHIRYRGTSIMAVISLVAAGLGAALVPSSIVTLHLDDNVVFLPLTGVTEMMEMIVAYRRDERAPAVRAFCEIVSGATRA